MADSRNEENPVFFYQLSAICSGLTPYAISYMLSALRSSDAAGGAEISEQSSLAPLFRLKGAQSDASLQYNVAMYKMAVFLAIVGVVWPSMPLACEELPPHALGVNERLTQALGSEGGAQVYKDPEGNVETILDPPGGERRVTVQPPQSPSMNLGPPLQLHNPPLQLPPAVIPAHPPSPEFPQKAR